MTEEVVKLNAYMSLREAARVLAEHNISGAPVVDNDDRLIGVLTETDILRAVEGEANQVKMVYPSLHTMGVMFELAKGETEIVKAFERTAKTVVLDVMTKGVITVSPDDLLNDAARKMINRGINRLPVTDDDMHVVGIITRGDIIRALSVN